jgi:hypothetical protein
MSERLVKCEDCGGKGYFRCDCWPGDCICDEGDEACFECGGDGFIDISEDHYCPEPHPADEGSET